ncbi:hypothetical protein PTKIN_Ptkin05aG0025600 [Pterospermum kingtungense]
MDNLLRNAALNGDVNKLYQAIAKNPGVLEDVDKIPYVETPLHIAASRGHINFAVEIMRLKPCFSKKPNEQGWSPMHLALEHKQRDTVLRLLETEEGADLVRVKGRDDVTPLQRVVQQGDLRLLKEFLYVSPYSIIDATNQSETALHIAVKEGNIEALKFLLLFLRRSRNKEAYWEEKILNWKDINGYTVLHVAAQMNRVEMVRLLLKYKIDVEARSLRNETALHIVPRESEDVLKNLLQGAEASDHLSILIDDMDTKQLNFKPRLTVIVNVIRLLQGLTTNIPAESRDPLLVVAALIATATFQAVLSPPGGLRQADSDRNMGKVVINEGLYMIFLLVNGTAFWVTTITIFLLLPQGFFGRILTLL